MAAIVRRGEMRDLPSIAALTAAVQRLHFDARPDHFCADDAASLEAALKLVLEDATSTTWVIEEHAEIVAYAVVRTRHTDAGPYLVARHWWEVDQLCVAKSRRGTGMARTLIDSISHEAIRAGVSSLELQCWSFNQDAQRAFAHLGFVPKGTRFELALGQPGEPDE